MSNLVIVAIPDENDRVWKVSSEKVPHCTLLFLGDESKVSNLESIVQFVEHAASTTLKRFYLPVDRRGELGADKADVLFFKKSRYDFKAIRDFRATLLQDNNIKTAYDSAAQFEGWTPHLTLGYPATPAKPDPTDRDYGFYDVSFTKIAVWTGDFEGPEFLLKDYWDEEEDLHGSIYDTPLAGWSDIAMSSMNQERVKAGLVALDHSGVKGMKWGVRKLDNAVGALERHAGDRKFKTRANSAGTIVTLTSEARDKLAKEDLPAINAKYEGKAKTGGANQSLVSLSRVPVQKAYKKEVQDAYLKHLNAAAESRTNTSGTKKYTIDSKSATRWKVKLAAVAHADLNSDEFEVELVYDNDGFIVDIQLVTDNAMAQSAMYGETFVEGLMHVGIKGMKWGVRKPPPAPVAPTATSKVPHGDKRKTKIQVEGGNNHPAHDDAIKVAEAKVKLAKSGPAALSNQELRDVANRVQLEHQVSVLLSHKGKKFVTQELQNEGKNLARQGAKKVAKKAALKVGAAALI